MTSRWLARLSARLPAWWLAIALLAVAWPAFAREWVALDYAVPGGDQGKVEALLRKPAGEANGQAVLLLHHAGGFSMGTTAQYAGLLADAGFTTLELRMFDAAGRAPPPPTLYAMMASALAHLSRQPGVAPDRVSAMGLSLGALMTVGATSEWFYSHHGLGGLRFHRLAAVYPVCWMLSEALAGRTPGLRAFAGLPSDFLTRFAGVPLLILAAGKDDYDGSDPDACPRLVRAIPDEPQARRTEVKVYSEATHGWDHGRTYDFVVFNGCAIRATCRNYNVFSPETVRRGKQDLLAFFSRP